MKKTALVFLFLFFLGRDTYAQIKYPNPIGHINDFANIIDPASQQMLENKLRDYAKNTSIEIAVATVNSLEGITIDEYALNLFEKWGVGDKEKSNGILLLVAPNEREMRIEVGYGMEPDLTDGRAGSIIRENMIPYFKKEEMAEGVVSGVNAILNHLGTAPFEARLEERRIVEEKRLAEEKRRAENSAAIMRFAGVFLAGIIFMGTPIVLIIVSKRRKQALKNQYDENIKTLAKCRTLLEGIEKEYPNALRDVKLLKKDNPKEVWKDIEGSIREIPERATSYRERMKDFESLNLSNGWEKSKITANVISEFLAKITALVSLTGDAKRAIFSVNSAKEKSPGWLTTTLQAISKVRESKLLDHKDVSQKARQYLVDAERKCNEAKVLMTEPGSMVTGPINWLTVYAVLTEASSLVDKAKNQAKLDKENAEEARRPKPVYRPSSSHRSSGSGGYGGFGGSRGSSSGGFGGFGGGRSGGGGARGKW